MITRSLVFALALFTALAVVSCGSSSAGSQNSCGATFNALCQRACSCGGGSTCNLVEVNDGGASASIDFNTLSDCEGLYGLTCGMPGAVRSDFDYAACTSAAQAAVCVTSPGGGMGVAYPAVCNPNGPLDAGID
jgi:hypothetical protein